MPKILPVIYKIYCHLPKKIQNILCRYRTPLILFIQKDFPSGKNDLKYLKEDNKMKYFNIFYKIRETLIGKPFGKSTKGKANG